MTKCKTTYLYESMHTLCNAQPPECWVVPSLITQLTVHTEKNMYAQVSSLYALFHVMWVLCH